ncbi:MAG: GNAT family N-acetyltransferase [Alphaproteobacteria bacterium]|nr:GNAT family N-acetyltransferase [Alphaproteobacteria bacterium]MBU1512737.1 GNAT family N-acetyltransferase [Alphaproteobacteria bacterium]MBU2096116.1 GNAT family N-acetyltransferase [Alphaproteobacteria bacterium]MBU2152472.1 GNAT family N-acetyltransferase [Alphaproteobacteria bacterium]MBU2307994.1 GNAT family N-acetyltransferase [Alphaproteobacteria bacterium]
MSVTVRVATVADAPLILTFIRELAEYERLLHEVEATEADIRRDLFGENPRSFCEIAEHDGQPVGFALWFYNYSTFRGRAGIYLEDLFVRPEARGEGAGKALLARLARRCVDAELGRLEWAVLNWNTPSIEFYDSLGASAKTEWTVRRLDGEALARLAESEVATA